ncbi:MAG: hypothetical protein R3345_06200 [Fulvivirga sp.]|nr:hypothetical protein [Fulvivirga sp.]
MPQSCMKRTAVARVGRGWGRGAWRRVRGAGCRELRAEDLERGWGLVTGWLVACVAGGWLLGACRWMLVAEYKKHSAKSVEQGV